MAPHWKLVMPQHVYALVGALAPDRAAALRAALYALEAEPRPRSAQRVEGGLFVRVGGCAVIYDVDEASGFVTVRDLGTLDA